jgi:hypothetical protein
LVKRDLDYIFHTAQPALLQRALSQTHATVRVIGKMDAEGLIDVYVRPAAALEDPTRMMKLLRTQLRKLIPAPVVGAA